MVVEQHSWLVVEGKTHGGVERVQGLVRKTAIADNGLRFDASF